MKSPGISICLRNHGLHFSEETVRQSNSTFLFVVPQNRSQIFLNEPVKDQRHRSAAQFFPQSRPLDTRCGVRLQLGIAAKSFRKTLIFIRKDGGQRLQNV
jgi:hypothetical protein